MEARLLIAAGVIIVLSFFNLGYMYLAFYRTKELSGTKSAKAALFSTMFRIYLSTRVEYVMQVSTLINKLLKEYSENNSSKTEIIIATFLMLSESLYSLSNDTIEIFREQNSIGCFDKQQLESFDKSINSVLTNCYLEMEYVLVQSFPLSPDESTEIINSAVSIISRYKCIAVDNLGEVLKKALEDNLKRIKEGR